MQKIALIFILAAMSFLTAIAQVGINTKNPNPHTALDVVSTDKGILIPRLTEEQRDALTLGEAANSLMIFNTTENCYNFWKNEEQEWKSLCGKMGKAEFDPIACNSITVHGTYVQGSNMESSNYLSIDINVRKAGTFSIHGTTGNGYYFTLTKSMLEVGPTTIYIPAQGKPVHIGIDHLTLSGIPLADMSCAPSITVERPTATYAIDCRRITVLGSYQVGKPLTAANKLFMYVTVTEAAPTAGSYTITSDTHDGLSFSISGHFTAPGTYALEIPARGTVTSSKIKHFTLTTNSRDGEATCHFTVTPVIPEKTVYTYGNGVYPISHSPQRNMLQSLTNFGPEGTVKYEGFTSANLLDRGTSDATMQNDLKSATPPDIIHVTYPVSLSVADVTAIVNYAKKGGVVLITIEEDGYIRNLINGLFDISNAVATSSGNFNNALFTLPELDNDPIINGPFGNLADKTFAFDGGWNDVITNIPPNKVTVYSTDAYVGGANAPTEGVVGAFKHNTLNVVFFPDGGTLSSDGGTSKTRHPVDVGKSPTYLPIAKSWTDGVAYNSQLLCNIMAWALNQAQYYGINSDKYK
jgi:hypothetical protein